MNLPLWHARSPDAATVPHSTQPMPLPQRPHSLFLSNSLVCSPGASLILWLDFGTQISSSHAHFPHVVYFSWTLGFWGDISRTLDVIVEPDSPGQNAVSRWHHNHQGEHLSLGEQGIPVLKKPRWQLPALAMIPPIRKRPKAHTPTWHYSNNIN